MGFGIGALLVKTSDSLNIPTIRVILYLLRVQSKIRRASNDTEYANKVLAQENIIFRKYYRLLVRRTNPQGAIPTLEIIQENVEAIAPIIEEIEKSNLQLQEAVEVHGEN